MQLTSSSDCTPCTAGYYCGVAGATNPTSQCAAGYVCTGGALSPFGATAALNVTQPCPAGHYCAVGTINPVSCPPGTFSSATGLTDASNCTLCSAGSYCASAGLTAPTGLCAAGYYCMRGNIDPSPTSGTSSATVVSSGTSTVVTVGGDVCTQGHYCGNGTSTPSPCAAGTYSSDFGRTGPCNPCPAGYYCLSGSSTYLGYDRCVIISPMLSREPVSPTHTHAVTCELLSIPRLRRVVVV